MMCRPGEDRCRFNVLQDDGTYVCSIKAEYMRTGKKPSGVPIRLFNYWLRECAPFPNPEDPSHCPPICDLKVWPRCGYKVVKVSD